MSEFPFCCYIMLLVIFIGLVLLLTLETVIQTTIFSEFAQQQIADFTAPTYFMHPLFNTPVRKYFTYHHVDECVDHDPVPGYDHIKIIAEKYQLFGECGISNKTGQVKFFMFLREHSPAQAERLRDSIYRYLDINRGIQLFPRNNGNITLFMQSQVQIQRLLQLLAPHIYEKYDRETLNRIANHMGFSIKLMDRKHND